MVASIEDVARRAGVSIATVSRALRGLPDVAASTRDRVLAAATDLDYVASPFAARLASGRTSTVGLVVPFVNRWFFSEVISSVETQLRESNFDLLLYNLGTEEGRARFFAMMPARKRVDGLVVAGLVLNDAEYEALGELGLPVGLLGLEHDGFLSVSIDNIAAARQAVDHLVELGHRRIALIGGDSGDPMRFTPPLRRRDGFADALRAVGAEPDPQLERVGYFTVEGGREAARHLLALPDRPTAIFAESDEMAYGAIREIYAAGLRIPDDVAVVGFDDQPFSTLMDLTTVRQPVVAQALDVTTRLLASIADRGAARASDGDLDPPDDTGDEHPVTTGAVVLDTELVVRASTVGPTGAGRS
ncbi:LacI family DNA-binding transcriptional regulator [Jatrophihabitans endophyticus]|uniref:LacI family DNA-binding transcriptional regulator n=1 Tax=Jatrophihabitans endophyticus TaxID=1206085 RepID=UPI0026F03E7B|nr:LacI family DNA-binding transcriptional regulator [Jatrophihabitans endophyticus]